MAFWKKDEQRTHPLPEQWTPELWDVFTRKNHDVHGFVGIDAMNVHCDVSDLGPPSRIAKFAGRYGAGKLDPLLGLRVSLEFSDEAERPSIERRFGEGCVGFGQTINWSMGKPLSMHLRVVGAPTQQKALEELVVRAKILGMPYVTFNFRGTEVDPWWESPTFARVFKLNRVTFIQNLNLTGDVLQESGNDWP